MARTETYSVKRSIMNAVMQLMTEKPYADITVTDIVRKAGVARASFYRNFDTISDVIDLVTEETADEIISGIYPIVSGTDERLWREFLFNHFYRFIHAQKEMPRLRPENMSVFFNRVDSRIQQYEDENMSIGSIREKYQITGKIGLINNISKKWMNTGMKETPEELIDYIMSFITSF